MNQTHKRNQISALTQQEPKTRAEGAGLRSKVKINSIAEPRSTPQISSVRKNNNTAQIEYQKTNFSIEIKRDSYNHTVYRHLYRLIIEIEICYSLTPNLENVGIWAALMLLLSNLGIPNFIYEVKGGV
jgi:hypothetical protein